MKKLILFVGLVLCSLLVAGCYSSDCHKSGPCDQSCCGTCGGDKAADCCGTCQGETATECCGTCQGDKAEGDAKKSGG